MILLSTQKNSSLITFFTFTASGFGHCCSSKLQSTEYGVLSVMKIYTLQQRTHGYVTGRCRALRCYCEADFYLSSLRIRRKLGTGFTSQGVLVFAILLLMFIFPLCISFLSTLIFVKLNPTIAIIPPQSGDSWLVFKVFG